MVKRKSTREKIEELFIQECKKAFKTTGWRKLLLQGHSP